LKKLESFQRGRELGRLLVELFHPVVRGVLVLLLGVECGLNLASSLVETPPRTHDRGNIAAALLKILDNSH
jgi:hypothetical protein